MLCNTQNSYGSITKVFHWLISLSVICLLIAGLIMVDMKPGDQKWQIYAIHKEVGLAVLFASILRIFWNYMQKRPEHPEIPAYQEFIAKVIHFFLYFFTISMPMSGLMMSLLGAKSVDFFGLFTIAAYPEKHPMSGIALSLHVIFAYTLMGFLALHILGALYHHLIRKDNVLRNMWPSCFSKGCSTCKIKSNL